MPEGSTKPNYVPATHHLDARASHLIDSNVASDDDLLTSQVISEWLQVSRIWLDIGRGKGWGPPFVRIAPP
jgi:hypothetical protein